MSHISIGYRKQASPNTSNDIKFYVFAVLKIGHVTNFQMLCTDLKSGDFAVGSAAILSVSHTFTPYLMQHSVNTFFSMAPSHLVLS